MQTTNNHVLHNSEKIEGADYAEYQQSRTTKFREHRGRRTENKSGICSMKIRNGMGVDINTCLWNGVDALVVVSGGVVAAAP